MTDMTEKKPIGWRMKEFEEAWRAMPEDGWYTSNYIWKAQLRPRGWRYGLARRYCTYHRENGKLDYRIYDDVCRKNPAVPVYAHRWRQCID
jgi:hypothetical protein